MKIYYGKYPEEYQAYREYVETTSKKAGSLRNRLVEAITYAKENITEYLAGVTQSDGEEEVRNTTDITIKTEALNEIKGEGR